VHRSLSADIARPWDRYRRKVHRSSVSQRHQARCHVLASSWRTWILMELSSCNVRVCSAGPGRNGSGSPCAQARKAGPIVRRQPDGRSGAPGCESTLALVPRGDGQASDAPSSPSAPAACCCRLGAGRSACRVSRRSVATRPNGGAESHRIRSPQVHWARDAAGLLEIRYGQVELSAGNRASSHDVHPADASGLLP